jgi:RNA polymerase sigma factor (sigma-70 family)
MSVALASLIRRMQSRVLMADGDGELSDTELLRRFADGGDRAAFELLVWRHGLLVLRTCRRILAGPADVEDAFQATFLALIRQCKQIRKREVLAGWLLRVARRIALRARQARYERKRREQKACVPEIHSQRTPSSSELRPILDEEIDRLPERFRIAFALCHLQGKTHDEAAKQLGVPKGTLRSRLARAREKLRFRLSRRGVTLGAGAGVLGGSANGELSAALVRSTMTTLTGTETATASAVVSLAEGVLRAMFLKKIKIAATILVAVTFAAGSTAWACHGLRWRARCYPDPPAVCVAAEPPPVIVVPPPSQPEEPKPPEVKKPSEPPAPPIEPRLAQILTEFKTRNAKREHVLGNVKRTVKDRIKTTTFEGEFRFLRPGNFALRMIEEGEPNSYELYVLTEKKLYIYQPITKRLLILPDTDIGLFGWFFGKRTPLFGPLSYLLGLEENEILTHVKLKVIKDVSSENPHYIYIEMRPRSESSHREFTDSQIALYAKTLLPRRLWTKQPNGDEILWDFPSMDETTKLRPMDFAAPAAPENWETITVPKVDNPLFQIGPATLQRKPAQSSFGSESACKVVENALKAHGGAGALAKGRDRAVVLQARFAGPQQNSSSSIEICVDGKKFRYASQGDFMGRDCKQTIVYDGEETRIGTNGPDPIALRPNNAQGLIPICWIKADGTFQLEWVARAEWATIEETMYMDVAAGLASLDSKDVELSIVDEKEVGGRALVGVRAVKMGCKEVILYFDKQDHLLSRIENRRVDHGSMQEVTIERIFSDYKEIDGIKRPMKLSKTVGGKKFADIEFTEFKYVDKLDDHTFGKPK